MACKWHGTALPFVIRLVFKWDSIAEALMRPVRIKKASIAIDNMLQSRQAQNQKMIKAFLFTAQHITLRMGICIRCLIRYFNSLYIGSQNGIQNGLKFGARGTG